jgi:hypothetical protein
LRLSFIAKSVAFRGGSGSAATRRTGPLTATRSVTSATRVLPPFACPLRCASCSAGRPMPRRRRHFLPADLKCGCRTPYSGAARPRSAEPAPAIVPQTEACAESVKELYSCPEYAAVSRDSLLDMPVPDGIRHRPDFRKPQRLDAGRVSPGDPDMDGADKGRGREPGSFVRNLPPFTRFQARRAGAGACRQASAVPAVTLTSMPVGRGRRRAEQDASELRMPDACGSRFRAVRRPP